MCGSTLQPTPYLLLPLLLLHTQQFARQERIHRDEFRQPPCRLARRYQCPRQTCRECFLLAPLAGARTKTSILTSQTKQSQSDDPNVGSAQKDPNNSNSASSLLSTLVPVLVVAIIWLVVFTFVRPRAGWKYAPRTSAKTLEQRYAHPPTQRAMYKPGLALRFPSRILAGGQHSSAMLAFRRRTRHFLHPFV